MEGFLSWYCSYYYVLINKELQLKFIWRLYYVVEITTVTTFLNIVSFRPSM